MGKSKEPEVSTDVEPFRAYFRFTPGAESPQSGVAFTPLVGEVMAGRIYEVNDSSRANALEDHPEWASVSERAYKTQSKSDAEEQEDQE